MTPSINHVYISYHWDIYEKVNTFYNKFTRDCRLRVWFDKKELTLSSNNESYFGQPAKKIRKSKIFLCFITKSYLKSKICIKELVHADKLDKSIIYIMIEDIDPIKMDDQISFIIGNSLKIDCYTSPNSLIDEYLDEIKEIILQKLKLN